jgi:hypothetical protein
MERRLFERFSLLMVVREGHAKHLGSREGPLGTSVDTDKRKGQG